MRIVLVNRAGLWYNQLTMKKQLLLAALSAALSVSAAPLRVALTYDDGFKDHHDLAAPILERHGIRATFNLVTDKIGTGGNYMSWDDARDLVLRGHDLASHTCSHPKLTELLAAGKTNEVIRQITESRDAINREIGKVRPSFHVAQLCHPFVDHSAAVDRLIRDAGLEPMTAYRRNFGNSGRGDVMHNGKWFSTAEYLDAMIAEKRTDVDILCHGVRMECGWDPFKTVADYERHIATLARYRDEGRIEIVLERDLRRYPGSIVIDRHWPHPEEAAAVIRRARTEGDTGPWTVIVREGTYPLAAPLAFTPEDSGVPGSPVRWIGEGDARFVGGQALEGWREEADGTWSCPIPRDAAGRDVWFETLYANGRRAQRARIPNEGFLAMDAPLRHEIVTNAAGVVSEIAHPTFDPETARANGLDFAALAGLQRAEKDAAQLQVIVFWSYGAYPIADFTTNGVTVTGSKPIASWMMWKPRKPGIAEAQEARFAFENLRAGFDAPGEWFYDASARRVRYRPLAGEKLGETRFLAPTAGITALVEFRGDWKAGRFVSDLEFENLAFGINRARAERAPNGAAWLYQWQAALGIGGAIEGEGVRRLKFRNCRVADTETYAFSFGAGVSELAIERCVMERLGAGGVWVGDTKASPMAALHPEGKGVHPAEFTIPAHPLANDGPGACSRVRVASCIIRDTGCYDPEGVGVAFTHVSDSEIVGNRMEDLSYSGVSLGWTWGYYGSLAQRNTVAFNRISRIGKNRMADMSGIYTLGASFGTAVSNNVVRDVKSVSYGGWGLYNDEGSEGVTWENNFVENTTSGGYHLHFGRGNVVRNNVFVNGGSDQVAVSRPGYHRGVTFEHNVFWWDTPSPFVRDNGEWGTMALREGWPVVRWGEGNFAWCEGHPLVLNVTNAAIRAERPGFANPSQGDFTLPADSPAVKAGFRPKWLPGAMIMRAW